MKRIFHPLIDEHGNGRRVVPGGPRLRRSPISSVKQLISLVLPSRAACPSAAQLVLIDHRD
jgi:hypothetical protein